MSLPSIYSRRKRLMSGATPDIFTYDDVPKDLRISSFMTMDRVANHYCRGSGYKIWERVRAVLREDMGVYRLVERGNRDATDEVETFYSHAATLERVLDVIELWVIFTRDVVSREPYRDGSELSAAVSTINARLLENGIGFEIADGRIIEKANEFAHQEVTLPALRVLSERRFAGANEEFREAHQAYRDGEYKDCLVDCLKAMESVIKVIASEKNWKISESANAKALIGALFENEFIPSYMQSQFASIRTLLESSVPTTRNKGGGHGQGTKKIVIPKSVAAFQLHQTAAVIIFLAQM